MPELPGVETSRRGIEPHLVGATILHATVRNGRLLAGFDEIHALSDKLILSVQRRAKYLLLGAARWLDHHSSWHVRQPADPWLWTKELEGHSVLAHLGPERFNAEYLKAKCAKKNPD